jgi:prephenate dehydrogenase
LSELPWKEYFQRIAIVGLGLLGGSWGLALSKLGFSGRVLGCGRRKETVERALAAGVIDEGYQDVARAVGDAELIILATPVGTILDMLPLVKSSASPRALVTDVGSTKGTICRKAEEIFEAGPLFLGAHPMAGKERSGLENADARLFENARYVLTPLKIEHLEDARVKAFAALVAAIGARPFVIDAASHDRAVAFLSHLPQMVSSALASLVAERSADVFLPLELAASGFRDVTRLAESPYSVWRDICLTNVENIQAALDALITKLEDVKHHLSDRELEREFKQAFELREKLREAS